MKKMNRQKKIIQFLCVSAFLFGAMPTYGLAAQEQQFETERASVEASHDEAILEDDKRWAEAIEDDKKLADEERRTSDIESEDVKSVDVVPNEIAQDFVQENEEPKRISELFPDPVLANLIAKRLDKPGSDALVEQGELNDMIVLSGDKRVPGEKREPIKDLTGISYLSNLKFLYLEYNRISDLQPLTTLTQLHGIYLNYNNITDITPLSNLTNVYDLDLEGNRIQDITPLQTLIQIEHLSLRNNRIEDISPLSALVKVRGVAISGNQFTDITPISNLVNITHLHLAGTKITDISALRQLPHLQYLNLNATNIAELNGINSLKELEYLNLSGMNLSDITFLTRWDLPRLSNLILQSNHITDLMPVNKIRSNFPKLRLLNLNYQWIDVDGSVPYTSDIVIENKVRMIDGSIVQPKRLWPNEGVRYEAPFIHWNTPMTEDMVLVFGWDEELRLDDYTSVWFSGYQQVKVGDEEELDSVSSRTKVGGKLVSTGGYTIELILVGGILLIASAAAMYALRKRKA